MQQCQDDRAALLNATFEATDGGAQICGCFNVSANTIKAAIQNNHLNNYLDVGRCLKAGTYCGSCIPEIKALF